MKNISVIVAIYNVKDLILQCLESMARQTLSDVEFILVDDGSEDGSTDICREFVAKDERFKLIIHDENKGLLLARKSGVAASCGKWIIFVDGDDCLGDAGVLDELYKEAEKQRVDILRFSVECIGSGDILDAERTRFFNKNKGMEYDKSYEIVKAIFKKALTPWNLWLSCYSGELVRKAYKYIKDEYFCYGEDAYALFIIGFFAKSYKAIQTRPIYKYRKIGVMTNSDIEIGRFEYYVRENICVGWLKEFLQKQKAYDEYEGLLNSLENKLYASIVRRVNTLPLSDRILAMQISESYVDSSRFSKYLIDSLNTERRDSLNTERRLGLKNIPPGILLKYFFKNLWRRFKKRNKDVDKMRGTTKEKIENFCSNVMLHNSNFEFKNFEFGKIFLHSYREDVFLYLRKFFNFVRDISVSDYVAVWGINSASVRDYRYAVELNKPVLLLEDGFIRSIYTGAADVRAENKAGLSFVVDTKGFYFDGNVETDLEILLNTREVTLTEEQYAKECIDEIIKLKISKYNNQPLIIDKLGKTDKKKVLIIDQSYGDMSLIRGLVSDNTFKQMIEDAIRENPSCEILFKIHPDTIAKGIDSGFQKFLDDRVTIVDVYANPISVINQVDKVYVATSQMGFEALMCGKEVSVYGLPFYAGWGLTSDKIHSHRRKRKLNLYQLFYIVYVVYSHYINPETGERSDIKSIIDYISKRRRV